MSGPELTEREWQALYTRLERPLYNLAYRYVWDRHEAQDAVHDAFLQLWARRRQIRADTADRYLWISVLNFSRKRRRWRRTRSFLYGEEGQREQTASETPESHIATLQEHRLLYAAVDRLSEKLRSVLLLTEFGEMSHEAVAELLSVPIGTVASRRHLALKQLYSDLQADWHEHS